MLPSRAVTTHVAQVSHATPAAGSTDVARDISHETDFVVIGAGIGGLSCAAMLALQGHSVTVLESHYTPGGAAHSFAVKGPSGSYTFEAGPSFHAGLSAPVGQSKNPLRQARRPLCAAPSHVAHDVDTAAGLHATRRDCLRLQVLDLVGESIECRTYNWWDAYLPEGKFRCVAKRQEYVKTIASFMGERAAREYMALDDEMLALVSAPRLGFESSCRPMCEWSEPEPAFWASAAGRQCWGSPCPQPEV